MRVLRRVGAGLWAAAGLLVGHELAYRFLYLDAEERAHALAHSGHGWTALLGPLVALFVAGATAATVAQALYTRSASSTRRRIVAFAVQVSFQLGAFMLLEVGERVAHGWSIEQLQHDLFGHHGIVLLAVGAVIQIICALGAAMLAAGIEAIVEAVRKRTQGAPTGLNGFAPVHVILYSRTSMSVRGRAPPVDGWAGQFPVVAVFNP